MIEPETPVPPTEPAPSGLPHLYIATPAYGDHVHTGYALGLIKTMSAAQRQGVDVSFWMSGSESLITRARNYAASEFLLSKATHLLFIDADIYFEPEDIAKILSVKVDVLAGSYPIKKIDWHKATLAVQQDKDPQKLSATMVVHRIDVETNSLGYVEGIGDCIEVKECGTGFMLITRAALEAYIEHYRAEIEYDSDDSPPRKLYRVFHADIVNDIYMGKPSRRYLSEDYWFCRKWREMGGKVFLHLGVELGHMGQYLYRGDPHEVHGGPRKGMMARPEDKERVMAVLQGSMMPDTKEPPTFVTDNEAKEGSFAVWVHTQWPGVPMDLYEPDPVLRSMLEENVKVYGINAEIFNSPNPADGGPKGEWFVKDGKVAILP